MTEKKEEKIVCGEQETEDYYLKDIWGTYFSLAVVTYCF